MSEEIPPLEEVSKEDDLEHSKIYSNPDDDPAFKAVKESIERSHELGLAQMRQDILDGKGAEGFTIKEEQLVKALKSQAWGVFIAKHPEKAAAYSQNDEDLHEQFMGSQGISAPEEVPQEPTEESVKSLEQPSTEIIQGNTPEVVADIRSEAAAGAASPEEKQAALDRLIKRGVDGYYGVDSNPEAVESEQEKSPQANAEAPDSNEKAPGDNEEVEKIEEEKESAGTPGSQEKKARKDMSSEEIHADNKRIEKKIVKTVLTLGGGTVVAAGVGGVLGFGAWAATAGLVGLTPLAPVVAGAAAVGGLAGFFGGLAAPFFYEYLAVVFVQELAAWVKGAAGKVFGSGGKGHGPAPAKKASSGGGGH
jgi:hypothetical protein